MPHWIGPLLVTALMTAPYSCSEQSPGTPIAYQGASSTPISTNASGATIDDAWVYNWSTPDTVLVLGRALHEISGLSSFGDTLLSAVQDEKGTLYFLSPSTGRVTDALRFGKNGDYEGVEMVGDTAWVVRSDGDLFTTSVTQKGTEARFKTSLKASYDIEGLTASDGGNRLLIAAKELTRRSSRVIFSVDVKTRNVIEEESIYVSFSDVGTTLELKKKIANRFKPSGIAVHPHSGQIYLLSSNTPALVVIDHTGTPIAGVRLDEDILPQPEGIAFFSDGTAFIASEGNSRGYLARFSPQTP